MYGNALAACNVADDLFAANRVATSRAVDQQLVLSFYLQRIGIAGERDALDGVGDARCRRRFNLGCLLTDDSRSKPVENLPCGVLPEADGRHQIVGSG